MQTAHSVGARKTSPSCWPNSGYPALLDAFKSLLQQYDSEQQRLSGLTKRVNTTLITPLLSALGDGQTADDSCARLSATLRDFERRRQILRQSARDVVRHEVQLQRGAIGDVLSSTTDVPAEEAQLAVVAGAASDAV
jgi:hypothetical protein